MSDDERPDPTILAWIQSGPEMASATFVERTLGPIPRMRQRRSWRITLDRWIRPTQGPIRVAMLAGLGVAAVLVLAIVGTRDLGTVGGPPSARPVRPTFELTMGSGAGAQTFAADPAASVSTCALAEGGPWHVLYAGGDPFLSLDLLVGAGADTAAGADQVAAEITTAGRYVRFDPAQLRGGDPAGRSTATVSVSVAGDVTTFVIAATTPDRTTGEDGDPIDVTLTVSCGPIP